MQSESAPSIPGRTRTEARRGSDDHKARPSNALNFTEFAEAGNRRRQPVWEGNEGQRKACERLAIAFDNAEQLHAAVGKTLPGR